MSLTATAGPTADLWDALERRRLRRGWSRMKLAEEAGMPTSTLYGLRDAKHRPQAKTVLAFAVALGMDPDEAFALGGLLPNGTRTAPAAPHPGDLGEIVLPDRLLEAVDRAAAAFQHLADELRAVTAAAGYKRPANAS